MNWRWVGALAGIVIVACAQAAQENDDDDGGTGGITGFPTSAGGATQSAVNATVDSANSTAASVVASTAGPGPASVVASSSSGSMNCAQLPTFEDCANCYCAQDPTGCQAYINVIDTYIYCGAECGTECTLYCSTLNPIDITTTCDACIANFDCGIPSTTQMQQDCTNFQNACIASTSCINFVTSLQNCP